MDTVAAHGNASIKKGSKSFALASRVLPPALRDDAAMLYAWCRYCDDVIDGQEMGHGQIEDYKTGQKERLSMLREKTSNALAGKPADDPVFAGLARVIRTHDIDHRHPFDLLMGFQMDAEERVYNSVDDILDYSYHAFQLTNIARDVIDDAKADRVFVPRELLLGANAPVDAGDQLDRTNWPALHKAACAQLDIAEKYYASAKVGIKELDFRCAWAISAALKVYREIGENLRKGGPEAWEGRVGASSGRKMVLALGAVGPAMRRKSVSVSARILFFYSRL